MANLHHGIRLVDSESLCCITTFNLPSTAASVQCLAWVPSAPGMFVTGGNFTLFPRVYFILFYFIVFIFGHAFGTQKLLGQESNQNSSDNAESATARPSRKLPPPEF